jgi:hypothetical protein
LGAENKELAARRYQEKKEKGLKPKNPRPRPNG